MAAARRRFVYQELFVLQLALALKRYQQRDLRQAPVLEATVKVDARIAFVSLDFRYLLRTFTPIRLSSGSLISCVSFPRWRERTQLGALRGSTGNR